LSDIVDLIQATVLLEQAQLGGRRTVGTGFVVVSSAEDGRPLTVLITAQHVLDRMPGDRVKVGFRTQAADGAWTYTPVNVRIRDAEGDPLWTHHPTQDVAAIELPPGVARSALPAGELPGERALERLGVRPGDEMMVLGFPIGFASNEAGFPILRSGRVASYPLSPAERYPTYMVDFNVFGGNSGGPVYAAAPRPAAPGQIVITGVLTQQVQTKGQRLGMGNVTQADFIVETLTLMRGGVPAEVTAAAGAVPVNDALPASTAPEPTSLQRLKEAWDAFAEGFVILLRRMWIVVRDSWLALTVPDARRAG
jgi:hypothetical protein